MMKLLALFAERAREIIRKGGSLTDINSMGTLSRILRMKSEIPNGDEAKMAALEQAVNSELDEIERRFTR